MLLIGVQDIQSTHGMAKYYSNFAMVLEKLKPDPTDVTKNNSQF